MRRIPRDRKAKSSEGMVEHDLLRVLKAAPRPVGEHYRSNLRLTSEASAQVAWTESGGVRHRARLRLHDISRIGAAGMTRAELPVGRPLLLRLVEPEPTPWIEVIALAVEPQTFPWRRVRFRFAEPCADLFLKAAVLAGVAVQAQGY